MSQITFFTIVLNGMPFLRHHYEMMRGLKIEWKWVVIEGVASLTHDTGWGLARGAQVNADFHRQGLSCDGTTEYLDQLKELDPSRVIIKRPPAGEFWDGKKSMVNAVLDGLDQECLLWEIDADELWATSQVNTVHQMFLREPTRTAAFFRCNYFVGRFYRVISENTYGNYSNEWLRIWRYRPGMWWDRHEPPVLVEKADTKEGRRDIAYVKPFKRKETEALGLVFQHYAYVEEQQLRFKETYYGYQGAVDSWKRLNECSSRRVKLGRYFDWVQEADFSRMSKKQRRWAKKLPWLPPGRQTMVERVEPNPRAHLARVDAAGRWHFNPEFAPSEVRDPQRILLVRTDNIGDAVLSLPLLRGFRRKFPGARIKIACSGPSSELLKACLDLDEITPFAYMHPYKNLRPFSGGRLFRELVRQLRSWKADWAINPQFSRTQLSDQLTQLSGAAKTFAFATSAPKPNKKLLRADRGYGELTSLPLPVRHEAEVLQAMADLCGVGKLSNDHGYAHLDEDILSAQNILKQKALTAKGYIVLFAGTSELPKNYRNFGAALRNLVAEHHLTIVALGDAASFRYNEEVIQSLPGKHVNLSGQTTIREAAYLLSLSSAAIGSDTSHAHLAGLFGIPTVVVAGGAYHARFFSTFPSVTTVTIPVACAGCGWGCQGYQYACIQSVEPVMVEAAFKEVLFSPTPKKSRLMAQTTLSWPQGVPGPVVEEASTWIDANVMEIVGGKGRKS